MRHDRSRRLRIATDVFRRWLTLDDPLTLHAALATYAANLLPGDPVWLLLVGGSGTGKTETAMSLAGLPGVRDVATVTEAGLLSGSSRRDTAKDATGGLLQSIGDHGFLVLKDFTSILSMNRDGRAALLAALREIADGRWVRTLGTDGGRTLEWQGRLGLLGCVTSVIDSHHAVMAVMGERFLLCRMGDYDPKTMGRRALSHAGFENEMRHALATTVQDLFADGLPAAPLPVDNIAEYLVTLAHFVATARSPVQHDKKGDVEFALDAEAPTRITKALGRFFSASGAIGLDEADAWQLTARVALDCVPKFRLGVMRDLATGWTTLAELRNIRANPPATLRRCLDELAAHNLVDVDAQGQGTTSRWRLSDWARYALELPTASPETSVGDSAASPEMSAGDTPASPEASRGASSADAALPEHQPMRNDKSGEVIALLQLEFDAHIVDLSGP